MHSGCVCEPLGGVMELVKDRGWSARRFGLDVRRVFSVKTDSENGQGSP